MNSMFYKGLIQCYGKSYMFLTKINQINDTSWLLARLIADEIYLEENINIIKTSSNDKLTTKKKHKIGNW